MPRKSRFENVNRKEATSDAIRVVIYTRISVDRDTEQSIRNQIRECKEYAKANGYEVVGDPFVDRGKSAYKLETVRPGFDAAMATVKSGRANRLLVWKLDRMTRNARGFMRIHDELTEIGATFQSVKEPWFDTGTPIGLALVMLMAALAQMEAEGIQGRAFSWHEGRTESLLPPVGKTAFGYTRPEPNTLAINETEQALVVEMATRILNGDSLRSIARSFNDDGIPTQSGAKWSHTTIRSAMLNPTTAALVETSKGNYEPSPHWEPLIDPAQWHAVNAVLSDPLRITNPNNDGAIKGNPKFMLTGLMRCGRCDGRMAATPHRFGRRYKCDDCEMSIDGELADNRVSDWIMANVTDEQWKLMRAAGKGTETVEEVQGRINELFIERTMYPNRVPKAVYESAVAALEAQLAAANEECAIPMPDVDNLHTGWATMTVKDQRTVIGAVIDRMTVAKFGKGCTGSDRIIIDPA